MRFARAIWKILVGVKDALVLLFMLMFFGVLYAALSARPEPVHDGILALDLNGVVVEEPTRATLAQVAGGSGMKQYRLRDLVRALDEARGDDRVKAVALDLEGFAGGGQTAMGDLAEAIREVRDSGKPVIAYSVGYTDDGYQLAAAASEVWLNPLGLVAITGPGGQNLYYRGLLEKLGVTPNVYRVGEFKAAVEPFTRSDMSPEAEANARALYGALFEQWQQNVSRARPNAKLNPYVQQPVAAVAAANGDMAEAAKAAGLVDRLADRQAFEDRLTELGGEDRSAAGGYKTIALDSYIRSLDPDEGSAAIGVVTVAGMIVDGEASPGTAGGDSIARMIEKGIARDKLKALVVRVDSPGGSVLASERIRQALLAAKRKELPVVVSMGNVAASGGYWVATPANYIFAEPSTVTGSIGVFGILPSFEGTREKLGLGADGVKTTPLTGEPDLLNGPSPEAEALIQASMNSIYRRFLGIVSQSRGKPPAEIDRIAQGRVWDGGTARQLGLVDGFGGMEEAIAKAAQLAKVESDDVDVVYFERPMSFEDRLVAMLADRDEDEAASPDAFAFLGNGEALILQAMTQLRSVLAGPKIQAICLDCPPSIPATAQAAPAEGGLVALVRGWLG